MASWPRTVALVLVSASAVAAACGEGDDAVPGVTTAPDGGEVASAECPPKAPVEGAECLLPEGTTCAFDVCAGVFAVCEQSRWRFASNAPARPDCPDPPPGPGDPCPPCWAPETLCTYGAACESPDAGERRARAQCKGPTWEVTFEVCRDGGSATDADVQGDADDDSG